jgi:hypothetical protein
MRNCAPPALLRVPVSRMKALPDLDFLLLIHDLTEKPQ